MRLLPRVVTPLILILMLSEFSPKTFGQDQIRDFTRPFVVLETGGHSAPVRSLIFTPEGDKLLSSGMDKVVREWNFADGRPRITRTIRPPIWRGPAGTLYAMALSPVADAKGQRLLAIGGYGLWNSRGNITLMRYPGDPAISTGEVAAMLPGFASSKPQVIGHANTITSLAFSPDGRFLASCGNDGRVILWDVKTSRASAELLTKGPAQNVLAFRQDGKRLAAGGVDGIVRMWDVERRVLIAERVPTPAAIPGKPADAAGLAILCLGFAPPHGDQLILGRENGRINALSGDTFANPVAFARAHESNGPIEALAISHDGKTLATSVVSRRIVKHSDRPTVDCEIQFRSLPDGDLLPRRYTTNNLSYALTFSPDDQKLAYAGGDSQGLVIADLAETNRPNLVLQGQGASVWQVGFGSDSRSVAFSHAPDRPGAVAEWIGFDLTQLALKDMNPATISRAISSFDGARIDPIDPYNLKLTRKDGTATKLVLDPSRDRRWWGFSFLPPSATHPKPCVAVACDGGVAIFRVEDGARTRTFAGHSSPVYDLAPSTDGAWLVTGSSDQTVRIWALRDCDSTPSLGASFDRDPTGKITVADVKPRSFAEGMGLKKGDAIESVAIDEKKFDSIPDLKGFDRLPPGPQIQMFIKRGAEQFPVGTTRRDAPRLSLFVGEDREWVLWMPEGFYETSVAGDRKYLGWHRNGADLTVSTDHFPAEKFEKEFRKPAILSALLANDDPGPLLALQGVANVDPAAVVQVQAPPVVKLSSPAPAADGLREAPAPGLTIQADISAEGRSPIASLQVLVDGHPEGPTRVYNPPQNTASEKLEIPVHPGLQKVVVEVVNADGKTRTESIDVVSTKPVTKPPTLHVVAIGASGPFRDAKFPEIPFADDDAKDLRAFLAAPGGKARFEKIADRPILLGEAVTGRGIREALLAAEAEIKDPNDMLVVILESHVLTGAKDHFVIATDAGPNPTTADLPTAEELGDMLAKVAARGSKVLLLLDTSHERAPEECRKGLTDWVRSLSRRNIITVVAANHGASRRVTPMGHGAFAQAILDVFDARARSRPWIDLKRPITLDDFQDAVVLRVKELTSRKQFSACYIPETLSPQAAIFEPNKPQNLADAKSR